VLDAHGRLLQRVRRHVTVPCVEEDWRGLDARARQQRLDAFLAADRRLGFDITRAPMLRLALLRVGDDAWDLIWTHHHALLDGWSLALVFQEALTCYDALRRGEPIALPPARPYRDYVQWLIAQDTTAAEAYWQRTLHGFAAPASIGGDVHARDDDGRAANVATAALSAEETAALQETARERHATLNTFCLAAWALVLARHGGDDDVLFGSVATIRPPELSGADIVGLCVNTLPVRVRVPVRGVCAEWLSALQRQYVEALTHGHVPFSRMQQWSEVPPGTPLVESLLILQNYGARTAPRMTARTDAAAALSPGDVETYNRTDVPLRLVVLPGAALRLDLAYDARRFDHDTITRVLEHVVMALRAMAADPGVDIADLLLDAVRDRGPAGMSANPFAAPLDALRPSPASAPAPVAHET
jgi:hypothetical protein